MLILGITTSLYPCLFPLLPTYMTLTMNAENNRVKGVLSAIYLTLGIITTFLLIAVIVKFSIFGIMDILVQNTVDLNVFLSLTLFISVIILLIGTENLPLVNRTPQIAHNVLSKAKEDTMSTAYIMGLVYTLIAAPCAFPVFFSAITIITSFDGVTAVFALLLYSLGAGIPFLILGGLLPEAKQTIFKKYQSIAPKIKYISASILLLLAIYLFDTYYIVYNPIDVNNSLYYNGLGSDTWEIIFTLLLALTVIAGVLILGIMYFYYKRDLSRNFKNDIPLANQEIRSLGEQDI
ncbi:MAG: Thiol:disulfide interchange protein DsbD precursor [Candidatus Heimdallarchaeota archaeon LC_3]|nr:MAG: Thiol:disulfide interchange protein DsbD precursor [Candidatus Heimdallarchaeota archaeon LC_3]